jgi:hypothetical protein
MPASAELDKCPGWCTRAALECLLFLHPDSLALRASPFPLLVIDVPFEFLHRDFATLAGHRNFMIALAGSAGSPLFRPVDFTLDIRCDIQAVSRAVQQEAGHQRRRNNRPDQNSLHRFDGNAAEIPCWAALKKG